MFLAAASCLLLGFILNISGVQGKQISICALKGSSVNLTCSAQHPTSGLGWYIIRLDFSKIEVSADVNHPKYSISEENNFTLTINNLVDSDTKIYCCGKPTEESVRCQKNQTIFLRVADLQVKVIPSTEGQTVTLMCSTSCPLTGNPAAYMWYKNGEFLYEDWSPWYQEMLSSDPAVRYSCAVKGYEDLRAPQVSVDSVSASCFRVTYSRGKMCSSNQTSHKESCSITYPRELKVERSSGSPVEVKCSSSCPEVDPKVSFRWYENRTFNRKPTKAQFSVRSSSPTSFSCAVKDHEDLQSPDVCVVENKCRTLNYASRRICAPLGSSVEFISRYSEPDNKQTRSWYKRKHDEQEGAEQLTEDKRRVQYHNNMNEHILQINNLEKEDSGEYMFSTQQISGQKVFDVPKVTLVITGLSVWIHPAEVTEGQKVTLTCSSSCPLSGNYTWNYNGKPLGQNKHLVLDPVSIQDTGNYSCAVRNMISSEKTLTVQRITRNWGASVATGIRAALVVLIFLIIILCIGKKKISSRAPGNETLDNLERPQNQQHEQIQLSVINSQQH